MKKLKLAASVAATLLIGSSATHAFTYVTNYKLKVNDQRITFYVGIDGVSKSGITWNDGFAQAASEWTMLTPVDVNTVNQFFDPCNTTSDGIGGVGFTDSLCGRLNTAGYPATTAAITKYEIGNYRHSPFPEGEIVAADIPFNKNRVWDIYDGETRTDWHQWPSGFLTYETVIDFRRVASHEIGHALGLGHSIFNTSIMGTGAADPYRLSIDDICGVSVLHGEPELCPIWLRNPMTFTGKPTSAVFVGGASADGGRTFADYFRQAQSIDVMATVVVEDGHWNKTGRLHVVVELSDGTALMKTDDGFAPWDGSVGALKTTSLRTLYGANEIQILKDFNLKANGIGNVGVAMYLGYSLETEPNEVYFSGTPIMFHVE